MRSLALYLLVAFMFASCTRSPNEQEIAGLKRQGDSLVAAVGSFTAEHGGRYPSSFAEAGITPPKAGWGGWQYSVTADGKAIVSIGEYTRDSFELSKQIGWKDWYFDT